MQDITMLRRAISGFPLRIDLMVYLAVAALAAIEIGLWLTLPTPMLWIFFIGALFIQFRLLKRCLTGDHFVAGPAGLSFLVIVLILNHFHQGVISSHELMRHYLSHGVIHSNNHHAYGVPDLWDTDETSVHIGMGQRFLISVKMAVFFAAGLTTCFGWLVLSERQKKA
ncbi:hypothetical protein IGS75_02115 [Gluconobacter sphaericus]|uniref:hypothetical protein n=1 Tax=Gluconobacter sphaericus TaxID=574987 RepID=UPI0019233D2A|nr:hypothetical protein [Gluconobacter sphaericus]QQX91449.1 hypothetical protein IGS75_02115 [Gluconobacter sphaericus]